MMLGTSIWQNLMRWLKESMAGTSVACRHPFSIRASVVSLTGKAHVNTKTAGEMLVRRRLGTLWALVEEYALTMDITLVKSCQNCADSFTRVPQMLLDMHKKGGAPMPESCPAVTSQLSKSQVADIHQKCGRLYFSRIIDSAVSKELVKSVLRACEAWQSIDPAPVRWEKGNLSVKKNWSRLAMDVDIFWRLLIVVPPVSQYGDHCDGKTPSASLASWKRFFYEREPPAEILTDNDTAFTCWQFTGFTSSWGVHLRFQCVHVPAGNVSWNADTETSKPLQPGRIVQRWKQSTATTWHSRRCRRWITLLDYWIRCRPEEGSASNWVPVTDYRPLSLFGVALLFLLLFVCCFFLFILHV